MSTVRRARPLLGTIVVISIEECVRAGEVHRIMDAAFAEVEHIHDLMCYHDPASELSHINREAAFRTVRIGREIYEVLQAAQRFSAASDGLFDVTIAPALTAVGFLPRQPGQLRASGLASWQDIELCDGPGIRFERRLRIDLGGIAKGYAVDRAIAVLEERGVTIGTINAGGDLRRLGPRPFALHVRHPASPTALVPIETTKASAATSAGYFQHRQQSGRQVSALIDPRSSRPCGTERSVTVLADQCMTADALSKIVYIDPTGSDRILRNFDAEALILPEAQSPGREHVVGHAHG